MCTCIDLLIKFLTPALLGIGLSRVVRGRGKSLASWKPIYKVLASYYVWNCSKSLWWVGGWVVVVLVVETYFSVQLKSRPS